MDNEEASFGTHYSDYLQLDKILGSQVPKSGIGSDAAHDEMLFIVIHQAYELWFKLILHELNSVIPMFKSESLHEMHMGTVVARFERVVEIQRVLVEHLNILETMTPLDFLDFRDHLVPASGFQSVQFRLLEATLGLRQRDRAPYGKNAYRTRLRADERELLEAREAAPSLAELVEQWLERIPFVDTPGYSFWREYKSAVANMLAHDAEIIRNNEVLSESEKVDQLQQLASTKQGFDSLLREDAAEEDTGETPRRFSQRAIRAALFIELYRDYPALQLPHKMLTLLVDIDELFTTWRQRHAMMVHRMIGRKIGTGGSSGHRYLQQSTQKHRIFTQLFDLPTYLIPRSRLPKLPEDIASKLSFRYEENPS